MNDTLGQGRVVGNAMHIKRRKPRSLRGTLVVLRNMCLEPWWRRNVTVNLPKLLDDSQCSTECSAPPASRYYAVKLVFRSVDCNRGAISMH